MPRQFAVGKDIYKSMLRSVVGLVVVAALTVAAGSRQCY
jgi:hypothetical protein